MAHTARAATSTLIARSSSLFVRTLSIIDLRLSCLRSNVESARYDPSLCGHTVWIQNPAKGITISAVIADNCPGCRNSESLDLSVGAWEALGQSEADGTGIPINWWLVN